MKPRDLVRNAMDVKGVIKVVLSHNRAWTEEVPHEILHNWTLKIEWREYGVGETQKISISEPHLYKLDNQLKQFQLRRKA